ncbi:MAG: aminotransferase class V-fold PLP-dependent enzyme, partial [Clostridiales bacterium]|nr:aminotransferase class V-fold PLP-dependent enzyme [Clostridiales bacterium]
MDKFKLIRKEYPGTQNQTYLDTATTGLLSNASYEAMKERLDTRNLKGLKMSEYFSDWNHADEMRKLVAQMINAEKEEVFYGKDCSEILNAIASNIEIPIGSNVVTANISFPSTRNAWLNREKDGL